jgi:molybdopterin molybdotransferase
MDLISVEAAQQQILAQFDILPTETIGLLNAQGRVLAENIIATADLPRFDYSSMDGYALRAEDLSPEGEPTELVLIEDIPAGAAPQKTVHAGQAARIMTGAALPAGANCVVPVENSDHPFRGSVTILPETVKILQPVKNGANVRVRGSEVAKGDLLLQQGSVISAATAGMLALAGVASVPVYRQAKIAIFSTGDEIRMPGSPLAPGQIYDANAYTLQALVQQQNAQPLALGIAPDNESRIQALFDQAVAAGADIILTTGGVSVGVYDFVRKIIEEQGVVSLWRVNMRPGKPLLFGHYHNVPVFGLPGNPVSCFVGFLVFVIPVIRKMMGQAHLYPIRNRARLQEPITSDGRESYLRASVTPGQPNQVHLVGQQSSGDLYSLVKANALLIIPAGVKSLPAGTEADVILLDSLSVP